jgi:vitamin B12 transporter
MFKNAGVKVSLLMTLLITGNMLQVAQAAEENLETYTLDPVTVTATRYEKKDVDVPAATVVLQKEDIKKTGAATAAGALAQVPGVTFKAFGQNGASMGTMTNEAIIRGVDNGTLVLLNGNPISWRGKYNLDEIPADSIERIEMVKGGGSVLYGSEAMSGVINIITKKTGTNSVRIGFGNFGQKDVGVNVGNEKFRVSYDLNKWDQAVKGASYSVVSGGTTRTDVDDVKKENFGLGYNINQYLTANYNYYKTEANYLRYIESALKASNKSKIGEQFNGRDYTTEQHVAQLNYDDKTWKGSLFFNTGTCESDGPTYYLSSLTKKQSHYNTREKNATYGADLQRFWNLGAKSKAILGFNYKNEYFANLYTPVASTTAGREFSRDNWAAFGQWEQQFDAKNSFTISGRETWTTGALHDQNYSNFSAAGQYLHKLDDENSLYASVGQSFIMPTFAEMYGASSLSVPNPDLKPQTGVNYELGWKKVDKTHAWKAAVYHIDIKDNISATWLPAKEQYTYQNEDFRNTGVELSCDINPEGKYSYNWNVGYNNPQVKSDAKGYWDRKYGRIQLGGGIGYKLNKFRANLSASFLGDRVQTPSKEHSFDTKSWLLTSLTATYSPTKKSDITLAVDNLLDRDDIISHSTSTYYATPLNFLLSYNYKF